MEESKVIWPGWEVVRKIGSGSFGAVYEIRRDMFGDVEKAALKMIHIPQNRDEIQELRSLGYDDASITTHFKGYLEDIVREYSLMNKMKGHTNVVYCDDIRYEQASDGIGWDIYIKMELLTPLMNDLSAVSTEDRVVKLGKDLCNALILCKDRNIVHRDIKPQNIFMSDTGDFKLGDFGVAKTVERTTGGTKIGTYKYMAPEVYNNQPYGHSSDIYALGLVLYWLLNEKRTPFLPMPPQIPTAAMEDNARLRRFSGEEIPAPLYGSEELQRIVLKACAFEPKDRYASASEMLADLKALRPSAATVATVRAVPAGAGTVTAATAKIPEPLQDEGTVNIFGGKAKSVTEEAPTEYIREEKTEYIREDKTEYIPRSAVPQEKPKKKKNWLFPVIAIVLVIAILLLLLRSCGDRGPADPTVPSGTTSGATTEPTTEPTEEPTEEPTMEPATEPTTAPTTEPATEPSTVPTTEPTTEPTAPPTVPPTEPPVTEAPKTAVPNVTGKAHANAKSELEKLGFTVELQYEKNDNVAEGNVIRQSPAAGTQLTAGSKVTLTVSSGRPTTAVANVVGKTKADAKSALEAQGFKVTFTEEYSATVAAGKVIRQTPEAGSGQFSGTVITVVISKGPILPGGVTLDKSSASLDIGATVQLKATVTPSDAHDKSVTWSSSNTSVATVSSSGLVTAKAPGTATITVKTNSGGKTATCTVTVKNPTIGSISNKSVFVGDTFYVSLPSVTPAWTSITAFKVESSNTSVVAVSIDSSNRIYVSCKTAGTATVTVSYTAGGTTVKTTFTVTVNTPKVTLSSYSGTLSWNINSNDDAPDLYMLNDHTPCWPAALPTATSNTGTGISWEVVSGEAFIQSKNLFVTNPAEKVVARAYFYYNGVKYYADYTNTLVLKKTTSASNYLRKGPGTDYGYYTSVPKGKTVTITEVRYDYSKRDSNGRHWAWGKVTYGGYTGWIVVY